MTDCPGCNPENPNVDHYHEYINVWGNCIGIWYIEGTVFQSEYAASRYVEVQLLCTNKEALEYTRLIPKKYGTSITPQFA